MRACLSESKRERASEREREREREREKAAQKRRNKQKREEGEAEREGLRRITTLKRAAEEEHTDCSKITPSP